MRHPKIEIKCKQCGKLKEVYFSDVQRGKGRFCSMKCWNKYKRILPKNIKCGWCGKEFENKYSQRNKKYCCKKCYSESMKGKPIPPNVQNKNGRKKRSALPRRSKHGNAFDIDWRNAVYKRDNYTCQWCGQKGGRLNADHIKPYAAYPHLRHVLSNGRTLCVECHKKTDSYGWKNYWNNYIKPNKIGEERLKQEVMF